MTKLLYCLVVLASSICYSPVRACQTSDPTAEIKGVVEHLFEAMQTRDIETLRKLFTNEGRLISTGIRNGKPALRNLSVDEFAKMVTDTKEPYRERMFDAEVRVEGDLATVWGRYDFHVGARLTNCGTNAFQLVRTADGWKIVQSTSTIHTEGCGQ
jgi:uncharacterized protein (TIGR02246 family)